MTETDDILVLDDEVSPPRSRQTVDTVLTVLVVGTGVLLLLVLLGAFLQKAAGLALILALCAAPALLLIGLVKLIQSASSKKSSWLAPVAMALGTTMFGFIAGAAMVVLMFVSLVVALEALCAEMFSDMR